MKLLAVALLLGLGTAALVVLATGCAFLGFGPDAGPQPPAPQHDLVPEWSGNGTPLFLRRPLDAGAAAAARAQADVEAADLVSFAVCHRVDGQADADTAIHCEWGGDGGRE